MKVSVGEQAPPFTLPDQEGDDWSLEAHRGTPVVLYFFPKADTPGCTTQACDVRDHWADFRDRGVEVVGISPDAVDAQSSFAAKYELPHRLLADPDRAAIDAYGAWGEKSMYGKTYMGNARATFIIDPAGVVRHVLPKVSPKTHDDEVLAALTTMSAAA